MHAWSSVTGHKSPYALDQEFEGGPALTGRVALVVLDGMRVDRAAELPAMQSLASRGASGVLEVVLPSLSNPGRAAMVTGAPPEVSGVTNNSTFAPPPVQSIFSIAKKQGMDSALVGSRFWDTAFPGGIDSVDRFSGRPASYAARDLAAWQASSCDDIIAVLGDASAAFMVADLMAGDEAGHESGGLGQTYLDVTAAVDACLGRLVEAFGPETTVVAVSDHGHIDRWGRGGHGGEEDEVRFAPFAMAGPGVRASEPIRGQLVDIAPTICALLGLPLPANSQGRVLHDALHLDPEQSAGLRKREQRQREALEAHMPNKQESLVALRRSRLPECLLLGLVLVVVGGGAIRAAKLWQMAIGVAGFAVAYALLFYACRLGYSISTVVRQEYLYGFLGRNVLAAAMAFGAAAMALRRFASADIGTVARLGLFITSAFALMVLNMHYRDGLLMSSWMIPIGPAFKAYMDLLAIVGVSLGTLVSLAYLQRTDAGQT